jgi:hypothetical protein
MNNKKIIELREKILKGIELAFEKLIVTKQRNNGYFVFSKNGKVITVKANELKNK